MRFEVKRRDGPARTGVFQVNNRKVETPNVIFISTSRIRAPGSAGIVETRCPEKKKKNLQIQPLGSAWNPIEMSDNADLAIPPTFNYPCSMPRSVFHYLPCESLQKHEWCVVSVNPEDAALEYIPKDARIITLANASLLFQKSRVFVNTIIGLREKIGYTRLLHIPGVATPQNLPLLVYLGVDFVDSISAVAAGLNNYLLFPEGWYHVKEAEEGLCLCPACRRREKEDDYSKEMTLEHNYNMLLRELAMVKNAIKKGVLRQLVETRTASSPSLMEKLRVLHQEHYSFLEKRIPVTKKTTLLATSMDSIFYPEVERFRKRVLENYRKPVSARTVLFLPCSVKKPYSLSKSHRLVRKVLCSTGNPWVVHEVIVTSPFGIVPRELELVYPACRYDIPVTDYWYEEEKNMIQRMIREYLNRNVYETIISHLPDTLNRIVKEEVSEIISTCRGHPISKGSLKKLNEVLKEYVNKYEHVSGDIRRREIIKCVAQYQFGENVASQMIKDDVVVAGRYPHLKILKDTQQIAALSSERGLLSLTLAGGEYLVSAEKNWVIVEENIEPKGSVLAVGVKDADPGIRVEDEIVVLRGKKLYATGVAKMNGEEMKEMQTGEAVRIRHHQ